MGIARFMRDQGARTRIVLADPVGSVLAATVRGDTAHPQPYRVQGIGGDFVPPWFDARLITHAVSVPDEESFRECRNLQRLEGLLVGGSAGCAIAALCRIAPELRPAGQTLVVLLPDSGRNYLQTIYQDS
jgi:cystathionine beta-synthase